jgi:hypothetical protein
MRALTATVMQSRASGSENTDPPFFETPYHVLK